MLTKITVDLKTDTRFFFGQSLTNFLTKNPKTDTLYLKRSEKAQDYKYRTVK